MFYLIKENRELFLNLYFDKNALRLSELLDMGKNRMIFEKIEALSFEIKKIRIVLNLFE